MTILGIETSCDETAAAVVKDGTNLLSNVVFSQIDLHKEYGGVVPEVAARSHLEIMLPVVEKALETAFPEIEPFVTSRAPGPDDNKEEMKRTVRRTKEVRQTSTGISDAVSASNFNGMASSAGQQAKASRSAGWDKIDAIAVTQGPGLSGSLLIGTLTARTLAWIKNKPLYGVNHVLAHAYANWIKSEQSQHTPEFPALSLIVSGGHTQIVLFTDHFKWEVLGQTLDDAAGEAFDKVAKILGLPYPGGPSIAKAAVAGDPKKYSFPIAQTGNDFSFSGLKTAVLRRCQELIDEDHTFPSHKIAKRLSAQQVNDVAASFQSTIVKTLVDKMSISAKKYSPKTALIAGGVAANQELRHQLKSTLPMHIDFAPAELCTDNAAMVASLAYYQSLNTKPDDKLTLAITPSLSM